MVRIRTLVVTALVVFAAIAWGDDKDDKEKAKVPPLNAEAVKDIADAKTTEDEKLAALHRLQSQHPHKFCWELHNELRHLYAGRDERASMGQCEIILSRSTDDEYILGVLSDWKLGKDNAAAAAALEARAARYSDFRHLAAACLLKARSLRQGGDNQEKPKP